MKRLLLIPLLLLALLLPPAEVAAGNPIETIWSGTTSSTGTGVDITPMLDLRAYKYIRVRGMQNITPAVGTRVYYLWQSFAEMAGTTAFDLGNNTSGRIDQLDHGANFAATTPVVLPLRLDMGPGMHHHVGTGLASYLFSSSSWLPGPYAKLVQYHNGTPPSAMSVTWLIEGERW